MSQHPAVRPYMAIFDLYAERMEEDKLARQLTRCLMQGVVYRDFDGMAFGEFIEPGHFFIYGWSGRGTLARFVEQYLASAGPRIEKVSWQRIRPGDPNAREAGPYDFKRIRRTIQWAAQK